MDISAQEKERIYREVQRKYHIQDAKQQVETYLESNDITPATISFDYEYLAEQFEEEKDCNIADNDLWNKIIEDYVQEKTEQTKQYYTAKFQITGRYVIEFSAPSLETALQMANQMCENEDFGKLSDIEWQLHSIEQE